MFRDRLADLFREPAGELGREAEILEKALSIVNRAKFSLEDLARLAEESAAAQKVSDVSDAVPEETAVDRYVRISAPISETANGLIPAVLEAEEECSRFEAALRASRLTIQDRMVEKIRVLAQANGGLVSPGAIAPVILKLGLSKSKPRNLPGYMLHEMNRSGEFQRVGEERSGLYRWLPFEGLDTQGGLSPENGERPASLESPAYEEALV